MLDFQSMYAIIKIVHNLLFGYQEIAHNWVFYVKMKFTRKARMVENGATIDVLIHNTYSYVVSRESVFIAFLIMALNELYILATDVTSAYNNAPCHEKIFTMSGPNFASKQ